MTLRPGLLLSLLSAAASAAPVDFTKQVHPILVEHCYHCHGTDEKDRKGGLRLDELDAALKGGESDGPAILPGKPEASPIILRMQSHDVGEVMPPPKAKNPVNSEQIAVLKQWVAEGAKYSRHWAFDPPVKAATPSGGQAVDALVKAKLASLQLQPAAAAEPNVLCRRLHLDLIGLPPSPQEVAAFTQAHTKDSAAATRDLISALMQRPDFGEKWARHWLDAARYSDSNGYEKDLPREQWAWRDWVISALNQDMPYDQFLVQQLAGDLLPKAGQQEMVATGFLRNSMINEEGAIVAEQFRMDEMFDRMDCIGKATLGLSIQCAQCHSHKFDPLSHDEYFGLFAFFNNSYEAQSWVYNAAQQQQIQKLREQVAKHEAAIKNYHPQWQTEMAAWEKSVLAKDIPWTVMKPLEMDSTSGLNHPTREPDDSVLTLGHPTTNGDIFIIGQPEMKGITGLRLEALTHRDLPHTGPGRSKWGTWAITELTVFHQPPGSEKWEPLPVAHATADFSEVSDLMEPEWAPADKPNYKEKRLRGPVSYMVDGKNDTGYRADRGPGLRNQEGVAVVQFPQPVTLPQGTRLKVVLLQNHSGGRSDRFATQLGRCRISLTTTPQPSAQPVDYAALLAMRIPTTQRTPQQQQALFTSWSKTLTDDLSKKQVAAIAKQWASYPSAETSVLHLAERSSTDHRSTHLLDRGAWEQPKHEVKAHTPAALHPLKQPADSKTDRLSFAQWLTDKQSPLTARVAVNRIWQAIFGQGLVETAEDFGTRTPPPEHRELLDWLAVDFMESGWSQKHLIRTILTSSTYQQSSKASPAQLEADPKNRLLTRGPRFRMEAEPIRDTALSLAGLLHRKVGGPSIFPPVPQSMLDYNYFKPTYWDVPEGPDRYRRALYVFRKRSMPDPVMSAFDAPNGDFACARRVRSNTPLSALTGLNETIFVEAAQALAQRILKEGGSEEATRIHYAYQLCMSRLPTSTESATLMKLLQEQTSRLKKGELKATDIAFNKHTQPAQLPSDATPNQLAAWTLVSRVLLNLDETLTKY